jgi:hypothetical protein
MTLRVILRLWTKIGRDRSTSPPVVSTASNLILVGTTGWHGSHISAMAGAQISPSWEAFPSSRDGGRNDFKGSRVVDKECASRSFLVTVR